MLTTDILNNLSIVVSFAGLALLIIGAVSATVMWSKTTKRIKQSKATPLDALFLSESSPGYHGFSIFNTPDILGAGIYTALALEQVGAFTDIKPRVEINVLLYGDFPEAHLSAARYYAMFGEKQRAIESLATARSLMLAKKITIKAPQLIPEAIESIISSEKPDPVTETSLERMFDEVQKNTYQLILIRSVHIFLLGIGLIFGGLALIILHIRAKSSSSSRLISRVGCSTLFLLRGSAYL